jgi:hypothetical protein
VSNSDPPVPSPIITAAAGFAAFLASAAAAIDRVERDVERWLASPEGVAFMAGARVAAHDLAAMADAMREHEARFGPGAAIYVPPR